MDGMVHQMTQVDETFTKSANSMKEHLSRIL